MGRGKTPKRWHRWVHDTSDSNWHSVGVLDVRTVQTMGFRQAWNNVSMCRCDKLAFCNEIDCPFPFYSLDADLRQEQ